MAASAAWVGVFALLVLPRTTDGSTPAGPIKDDAVSYLAMVTHPLASVMVPFCYRVGTPLLVRTLPVPAETGFVIVTFVSLALAGGLWAYMGRRLGLSSRALVLGAVAASSTQGWVGHFNNPYLTDGAGMLGLMLVWVTWMFDAFGVGLVVLAVTPLLRETVAPMGALWFRDRRWGRGVLGLAMAAAPLIIVRKLPGMPPAESTWDSLWINLHTKGPLKNLGDAVAAYQALWLLAFVGLRWAPPARFRGIAAPLAVMLLTGAALSLLGNTVRMFSLALPFMAYAVAEFFEVLVARQPRLAWGLTAIFALGAMTWFPTRPLGALVSSHKVFQYVFGGLAVLVSVVAWRRVRASGPPVAGTPDLASKPA